MDTSETYIKMCEKAEEIQGKELYYGDYWTANHKALAFILNETELIGDYLVPKIHTDKVPIHFGHWHIWLPRQDQLQEMIDVGEDIYTKLNDLDSFVSLKHYDEKGLFTSMEQLWLAFAMKEKYNKVWNGDEWTSG